MIRKTYYRRFPTAKAAMRAANRVGGAITDARGYKKSRGVYKTGFVAYTTRRKVNGWKKSKIRY